MASASPVHQFLNVGVIFLLIRIYPSLSGLSLWTSLVRKEYWTKGLSYVQKVLISSSIFNFNSIQFIYRSHQVC